MADLNKLLSYMKLFDENKEIQRKQTKHRIKLVEAFGIREGENVLEVGSGQGDTTVVLADAVGETGHVDAVDIANSDYGAPLTLKEATDFIQQSEIGNRITFQFETDVSSPEFSGSYDVAVLSHSLFYFSSEEELIVLFKKLKQISRRICVADWDVEIDSPSQSAHTQAILLQTLFAKYNDTDNNIRILVTKAFIENLLIKAGWEIIDQKSVDAKDLDDGKWEVAIANELTLPVIGEIFDGYKNLMNRSKDLTPIESLNSFVITAE